MEIRNPPTAKVPGGAPGNLVGLGAGGGLVDSAVAAGVVLIETDVFNLNASSY